MSRTRPVTCRLEGDALVFVWASHRKSEGGRVVCEVRTRCNWTDRTLSAFLRLRSAEDIPSFIERFGTLGKPNPAESECASTWLLWAARAKAILSFNDALNRKMRPSLADEKILGGLLEGDGDSIASTTFHGVKGVKHFFLARGISAWLNSPIPCGGSGNVIKVGIHRFGDHLTIEHQPTCLLGFLGLKVLQRIQGTQKMALRPCAGCDRKFRSGRVTQKYCGHCIKGKVRQRNSMRAYRQRLLRGA